MRGPERRVLHRHGFRAESGGHSPPHLRRVRADHHHDPFAPDRLHRVDGVIQHAPPRHRVQHLGPRGAHAGALARGQDHGGSGGHAVGSGETRRVASQPGLDDTDALANARSPHADIKAAGGVVVAFDLDGTLVDTAPDLIGALNQTLAREGLPSLPVSSARHLVGRGAPYLIEHGFAEAGRPLDPMRIDALEEAVVADYRSRITAESRPFPGCEAALDALIAEGAVLAVCTNKRTSLALPLLDGLDLTRRFAAICGGDLVAAGKPDPALLHLTIDRAVDVPTGP
jgi:phosphoglycolate phosphatase